MTTPPAGNRPPTDLLATGHQTEVLETAPPRPARPVLFVVLAYALSWAWVVPWAAGKATVADGRGWPTHLPALLGPLLAAVVCTALAGRRALHELGSSVLRWRIGWRWWLAAVSPVLALLLVLALLAVSGAGVPAAEGFARFSGIPAAFGLLGVAAVVVILGGLGEETGWRGYLQPTLQRRFGVLPATGLVAVAWAAWHAPLFWLIGTYEDFPPAMLPVFVGGLAAGSVVLAWLYNRTRSVLACAVWHGTYNLAGATAAATAGAGVISAAIWTSVVGLAIVLLALHLRAARTGRRSVLAP
jgi:membrane protease YdiL (CAAX protease family)